MDLTYYYLIVEEVFGLTETEARAELLGMCFSAYEQDLILIAAGILTA